MEDLDSLIIYPEVCHCIIIYHCIIISYHIYIYVCIYIYIYMYIYVSVYASVSLLSLLFFSSAASLTKVSVFEDPFSIK